MVRIGDCAPNAELIRGNAKEFMENIQPSDFGLADEAKGIRGVVQRIGEALKRIFSVKRFTVIYEYEGERKRARSNINEMVGWTPFKKMEYLKLNFDMDSSYFSGKRVLLVHSYATIQSHSEKINPGSFASCMKAAALQDSTMNFCHYFDYDNYDHIFESMQNGHHFQMKDRRYMHNGDYSEYFRLVGKKFLTLKP